MKEKYGGNIDYMSNFEQHIFYSQAVSKSAKKYHIKTLKSLRLEGLPS